MAYDQDEALQADIDETELLGILRAERENSVGFDYDSALQEDRERALNYYKGDVSADMPALPNRSSVTSTDVADLVERALPDLIEIFASGDDGITFQAGGDEDEDAAEQETDYVRHVIFRQNKGFRVLYTMFKDALLSKVGVVKFYWDGEAEYQEEQGTANEVQLQEMMEQGVEIVDIGDTNAEGSIEVTVRKMVRNGTVRIKAIPPEDFTVGSDTVDLADATYCAYRSRVRIQDLIADGYDPEKVMTLTRDSESASELLENARDTVEEGSETDDQDAAVDELRIVEVTEHYIRYDVEGDGRPQIWRIVTGNDEAVILEMEKRSRIEFAAVTPYPMTHRFYGQSLADKTIEIQKWKTALIRMLNDAGYHANNQRQEVNVNRCTEDTIPALLDNQPGRPIPTQGDALTPVGNAGIPFDVLGAIEFADTVAENRTAIVRNAQGLNPDTLHDTASGAEKLMSSAQKGLRMMARLFAEMGLTDMYLGVHDLLRSNATMSDTAKLSGKYVPVSPNEWRRRKDTEIDTGDQSKEDEITALEIFSNRVAQVIDMQGGPGGLVSNDNLYNLLKALGRRLRIKGVERYITDPAQAEPQEEDQGPSEEEMAMQMEQQKFQAQHQLDQQKAQAALELDAMKAKAAAQAQREQHAQDMELAREKAAQEAQLAREKMALEAELAREKAMLEASIQADIESAKLSASRPGGSLAE